MENLLEKIRTKASKIELADREKRVIRERLVLHMRANPPKPSWNARVTLATARLFGNIGVFSVASRYGIAFVAVLFLVLTSVSFGAESALPGEKLYSVKINVNEKIRSFLAIGDVSKASWEIEAVSRRLDEAEKLAKRGEISSETSAELEKSLDKSSSEAREKIMNIANSNKIEDAKNISSKFENELAGHEHTLAKLSEDEGPEIRPQLNSILGKIKEHRNKLRKSRENFESGDLKENREGSVKRIATSTEDGSGKNRERNSEVKSGLQDGNIFGDNNKNENGDGKDLLKENLGD